MGGACWGIARHGRQHPPTSPLAAPGVDLVWATAVNLACPQHPPPPLINRPPQVLDLIQAADPLAITEHGQFYRDPGACKVGGRAGRHMHGPCTAGTAG